MMAVLRRQHIPFAAACAEELNSVPSVDLLSQTENIHFDHVRENIVVLVPGLLGQIFPSEYLALAARPAFENRILLRRQVNGPASAGNGTALELDAKIANLDYIVISGWTPAQ